jgi:hypothetical protein
MTTQRNISWHKASNRWCAYGNFMGKRKHIGLFDTETDAALAAEKFKVENDIEIADGAPFCLRVLYLEGRLVWRQQNDPPWVIRNWHTGDSRTEGC